MKKVLIIIALISVNQAFATVPAKIADPKTTKIVTAAVKKMPTTKASGQKADWYMGAASVAVTTNNNGCGSGSNGGGIWGWFWGWFKH